MSSRYVVAITAGLALGGLGCASGALAQEDRTSARTTLDLVDCSTRELRGLESELETVLGRLREVGTDTEAELSAEADASWRSFRASECRWAAAEYEGGTLAPVVAVDCQLRLTRERLGRLTEWLDERSRREVAVTDVLRSEPAEDRGDVVAWVAGPRAGVEP